MREINRTGEKYHFLMLLEKVDHTFWRVRCDCGKELKMRVRGIVHGSAKSCGCMKAQLIREAKQKPPAICAFNSVLRNTKRRAKKRNQIFDLTLEEFGQLIQSNCYYCNKDPENTLNYKGFIFKHTGIDRIDSKLGYIPGNVTPCCKRCNGAKNDMTVDEFEKHIVTLYSSIIKRRAA